MIGPVCEVSTGAIARGRSSAHPTRSSPHHGRSHPGTDGTSRNDRKNRVFVIGARAGDLHSFSSKLGSCRATGGANVSSSFSSRGGSRADPVQRLHQDTPLSYQNSWMPQHSRPMTYAGGQEDRVRDVRGPRPRSARRLVEGAQCPSPPRIERASGNRGPKTDPSHPSASPTTTVSVRMIESPSRALPTSAACEWLCDMIDPLCCHAAPA
jgi:hypothetical protein